MPDTDCGHMTCQTWVTIVWHTGRTERHRCYSTTVEHGVLSLYEPMTGSRESNARCIPLTSIREYTIKARSSW